MEDETQTAVLMAVMLLTFIIIVAFSHIQDGKEHTQRLEMYIATQCK